MAVLPRSIHKPGAVPFGFGSTTAPCGTIACRRLMSGIVIPRRAKRSRRRSTIRLVEGERQAQRARDGGRGVTSSAVGPRPP